jgi:hypothetical protein
VFLLKNSVRGTDPGAYAASGCSLVETMLATHTTLMSTRRHPYPMDGISKRLLRAKILQLVARIESEGVTSSTLYEVGLMLRSLKKPRIPGMSVFPQLYVMSVLERERIYRTTLEPYLETELVGSSVGEAVFDGMCTVLEESYGLRVEVPGNYKWKIFHDDLEAGYLAYDEEKGQRVRRLRANLAGRRIVFCYKPIGLLIENRIHFDPSAKRYQIRSEVLPSLRRKEEEFFRMLRSKPSDFLKHITGCSPSRGFVQY